MGTGPSASEGSRRAREFLQRMVEEHSGALYRAAYHMTGRADDAEDLVQETFIRAWRFFHRFDPAGNARRWLFRILMNLYVDSLRRRKRRPEAFALSEGESVDDLYLYRHVVGSEDGDPAVAFFAHLVGDEVQAALRDLPAHYRKVILLFAEGFSYHEIAEILNLPIGTVMSRLHRARALLQKSLWEYCLRTGCCRPHPAPAVLPAACVEACRNLYGYLDSELDPATLTSVQQHLAVCRQCCNRLEFQRRLEATIREGLGRRIPRSLRSRLRRLVQLL
jgi:RNA polymerase sigma-70 factor (ECF subfamily)